MWLMAKRVYYYTTELVEAANDSGCGYSIIKDKIVEIINTRAISMEGFKVLDLSKGDELHYMADIFEYEGPRLFMRMSSQKPSGSYIYRDYKTSIPNNVLEGNNEDKEGIEIYTYALLDYATGILCIVNQKSAPNYKLINNIFSLYDQRYLLEFLPIPNKNGIDKIYNSRSPQITAIEVEVPIPDANMLERLFNWGSDDILDIQSGRLKATMRLSGIDRQIITDGEIETKTLIDRIKQRLGGYQKALIRGRAEGIKTQDFNFYSEYFSYPVEIRTYSIENGKKHYFTADQLITEYKDNLIMAFNENVGLLKRITNR